METGELTFHQLLYRLNENDFIAYIKNEESTDVQEEMNEYLSFIALLKQISPTQNEEKLELIMYQREIDNVIEVASREYNTDNKYSLDFVPWSDILSYTVNIEAIKQYPLEMIAFYVLYDMSFDGFREEERMSRLQSLLKRITNIV